MLGGHPRRSRTLAILPLVATLLLLGGTPLVAWAASATSSVAEGSAAQGRAGFILGPCRYSGIGDWLIDCRVIYSASTLEVNGDITLIPGGELVLTNGTSLIQQDPANNRRLLMQSGSRVEVATGATLQVGDFLTEPNHLIIVSEGGRIRSGGQVELLTGDLTMTNSTWENYAATGGAGLPGEVATFLVNESTAAFHGVTLRSYGGKGGRDSPETFGAPGGSSTVAVNAGAIGASVLDFRGGDGGDGPNGGAAKSAFGGGTGGQANASLSTGSLSGGSLTVVGGRGGRGGAGGPGGTSNGGSGGPGGDGGAALLNMGDAQGEAAIDEGERLAIGGGDAGDGGAGGSSDAANGGNGGNGGRGGRSFIEVRCSNFALGQGGDVRASAGDGGKGGQWGALNPGAPSGKDGSPGAGGTGGDVEVWLACSAEVDVDQGNVTAYAGQGGKGGVGESVGGDGGNGGSATLQVNASSSIAFRGSATLHCSLGARGGDGGNGAPVNGAGKSGNGGVGGVSNIFLHTWDRSPTDTIVGDYCNLVSEPPLGGVSETFPNAPFTRGSSGAPGSSRLVFDTQQTTLSHSITGTLLEGFDGTDHGTLREVEVHNADRAAVIDPIPGGPPVQAQVEVYYTLCVRARPGDVGPPPASATVKVFVGADDPAPLSRPIGGPSFQTCFADVLAQVITVTTSDIREITVTAEYPDGALAKSQKLVVTRSLTCGPPVTKDNCIQLVATGNRAAPSVTIDNPIATEVIKSENLAGGIYYTSGEARADEDREGDIGEVVIRIRSDPETGSGEIKAEFRWVKEGGAWRLMGSVLPGQSPASIGPQRIRWEVPWNIGAFDNQTKAYLYPTGIYLLSARTFDGTFWSDDLGRGGVLFSDITVTIQQPPIPVEPPLLDPTYKFDPSCTILVRTDGCTVIFEAPPIVSVPAGISVLRMEWDFNNDGKADRSYIPGTASGQVPDTPANVEVVFQEPGLKQARYTVYPDLGRAIIKNIRITVAKEPLPPVQQDLFPIYAGVAVIIGAFGAVVMLNNLQYRRRVLDRIEELRTVSRVEIEGIFCPRCNFELPAAGAACIRCAATDAVGDVRAVISKIRTRGVNLVDAEGVLNDAVDLLEQGSFIEAIAKAEDARKNTQVISQDFVNVEALVKVHEKRLQDLKDEFGRRVELPESPADRELYQAKLALGRGDFPTVFSHLTNVEGTYELSRDQWRLFMVDDKILTVDRMIANVRSRGIKVGEAEDLVAKARAAYTSGEKAQSLQTIEEAERAIREINKTFINASEKLQNAEGRYADGIAKGTIEGMQTEGQAAAERAGGLLEQLRQAFRDGLYPNVLEIYRELDKVLPKTKRKAKDLDWPDQAERLTEQVAAYAAKEQAEAQAKPTFSFASSSETPEPPTVLEARAQIARALELVAQAQAAGLDVTDPVTMVSTAQDRAQVGQTSEAKDLATNAAFLIGELLRALGISIDEARVAAAMATAGGSMGAAEYATEHPQAATAPGPSHGAGGDSLEAALAAAQAASLAEGQTPTPTAASAAAATTAQAMQAESKSSCPGCSKPIKARWKTCPYCGIDLASPGPAPAGPAPAEQVQTYSDPNEVVTTQEYASGQADSAPGYGPERATSQAYAPVSTEQSLEYQPQVQELRAESPAVHPSPAPEEAASTCSSCGKNRKSRWKSCPYCGQVF